ncbi:MAG: hypothetical protein JST80_08060 [Bdellovibrionales bacterium]|nr:hypothetical protein [Bdellovibrionales bacterium]
MMAQSFKTYGLILIAYLAGLWAMSIPLTGDQKVYLSVALEMRERAEWIIPYLFDTPNFLKPPLQYWATLIGWNVFGFSLFGALVPSVLALLGSAYLVNRLFKSPSGLAGVLFAACLGTMTYGTTAQMEIWIVLFYVWAWLAWKQIHIWRAFAIVGVMAWVKGPLYPALWVMSVALEMFLEKRRPKPAHFAALAMGIAIGVLWYGLAANTQWDTMKAVFFERENLGKMQTSQGTPWGLWGEFLYSLYPWFPILILAAFSAQVRARWRERKNFIIAYALIPAVFFTFFPYRVNTYLYILTPLFAWLASVIAEIESQSAVLNRVRLLLGGYMGVLTIAIAAAMIRLAQGGWLGIEIAVLVVVNLILWNMLFIQRKWMAFAWICLMLVSLVRVSAIQIGELDLAGLRIYQTAHSDSKFGYWLQEKDIWHEFGLVSAAIRQDISRIEEPGLDAFVKSSGVLLLSEEQHSSSLIVGMNLDCASWPRLKRRLKFPFKRLLREGLAADDAEVIRFFFICKARQ